MKTNQDLLREYAAVPITKRQYGGVWTIHRPLPPSADVTLLRAAKQIDILIQERNALRASLAAERTIHIPHRGKVG